MWMIRVIHPVLMSRMIITITLKAESVWAVYIIERIRPVTIWRPRVIPSKNPMFHKNEMDDGEGKSSKELFTIFRIGLFFVSWFFIKMMKRLFG